MGCAEFHPLLSEVADNALTGEARAGVEAHLAQCADCRQLLADLRRVREAGRALPRVAPPAQAWPNLRAALDRDLAGGRAAPTQSRLAWTGPSWWPAWATLAAAALVVAAVGGGLFLATRPAPAPSRQASAASAAPAQSAEAEIEAAQLHYAKAIAALEGAEKDGRSVLDPQTMAVLDKSNAVLDQAIQDGQAAIKSHPTSEFAQTSLLDALQRKVNLLRDTLALINEMRKGDEAGTARIVGSIGKS
jgi:tetratricopeptide (TPR) repeat protein